MHRDRRTLLYLAAWIGLFATALTGTCPAQQSGTTAAPLNIKTTTLPRAYVNEQYRSKLEAEGGLLPLNWSLVSGALPTGISLAHDGTLSGTPEAPGEYRFSVKVTDSAKPPFQREQELTLKVVSPLLARWGKYPAVHGQRIEGTIIVSNQTEHDFDLTLIVMAIADMPPGRATAIGYQHFNLRKDTDQMEIPFGDNLPPGGYDINADVVAEVAATHTINRVRLTSDHKLHVEAGP